MDFEVNGEKVIPFVSLYPNTKDFMGNAKFNLAVGFDRTDGSLHSIVTTNFGDFISTKNAAYIDVNNCPWFEEIIDFSVARRTCFTSKSGYCEYPLYIFDEKWLKEIDTNHYYEKYLNQFIEEDNNG